MRSFPCFQRNVANNDVIAVEADGTLMINEGGVSSFRKYEVDRLTVAVHAEAVELEKTMQTLTGFLDREMIVKGEKEKAEKDYKRAQARAVCTINSQGRGG